MLAGQVSITGGAVATVKVEVQVLGASQEDVAVNTTVTDPPQAFGAPVLLLLKTTLQPPVALAVANHVAYLASMDA